MCYLKIPSFLQGLYCISVNCMDNAEAQFTTALRVRLFFFPLPIYCGSSVWKRACLRLLCGSLEGKSGDSGQEDLFPAKYQMPNLWFIYRVSKFWVTIWLWYWYFVYFSSLRIKNCGRLSWQTWPACTSGKATGTKRWVDFRLILKITTSLGRKLPLYLDYCAFLSVFAKRCLVWQVRQEKLTLYTKFYEVCERIFLYKTWCLGSK